MSFKSCSTSEWEYCVFLFCSLSPPKSCGTSCTSVTAPSWASRAKTTTTSPPPPNTWTAFCECSCVDTCLLECCIVCVCVCVFVCVCVKACLRGTPPEIRIPIWCFPWPSSIHIWEHEHLKPETRERCLLYKYYENWLGTFRLWLKKSSCVISFCVIWLFYKHNKYQ